MFKQTMKKLAAISLLILFLLSAGCSKEESNPNEPLETIPNAAMIYLDMTQQVIRGFGGVNMPGWIPDMTSAQVTKAFGTGDGQIGLSILRIRVPYDPTAFNLEVATAQKAKALGAIVIASPWTPPAWMKSSNNIVGGLLNEKNYGDYSAHLKSFADYLANNGVPLYAMSIQNEPDVNVNYESCYWNASQMQKFVRENAPSIGTKIIMPEVSYINRTISDVTLNDPLASANVSIIGEHIYGGSISPYPLAVLKGKEHWMTEHLSLDTTWAGAYGTGIEIFNCLNNGMNAYLWWYIRRYYGPIDDNSNVTKRGFIISQYARFVRPGFVKVNATVNPQDYIYVCAFKNGNKIVIIAANDSASPVNQQFVIRNGLANSFSTYVTSKTKNCQQGNNISSTDGKFNYILEGESLTTFVSD